MKNELKIALCAYLPHGVKVKNQYGDICELLSISNRKNSEFEYKEKNGRTDYSSYKGIKPYLLPTSSLTKTIQLADYNGGQPFVPIEAIGRILLKDLYHSYNFPKEDENFIGVNSKHGGWSMYNFGDFNSLPYWIIDLLNRWKIDYRGLIQQGLAIEVTESNNPYL